MARPKVLSFPWISGAFRALTLRLGLFQKQRNFSHAPSPSKWLLGAFDEAVKGDPGPSLGESFARSLGDHSVQLAAANYRAKTLERENSALRGALARSASIAASPAAAHLSLADIREVCLDALSRSALNAAGRRGSTDIAPASTDELDILRERISRLWMKGGHQTWCGMFGRKVGWDDALIHKVEPFVIAFVKSIKDELEQPINNGERARYESAIRRMMRAEERRDSVTKENAALRERNEELATFLKSVEDRVTAARDAAERRIGDLLASNNALLARARAAEAALRPFAAASARLPPRWADHENHWNGTTAGLKVFDIRRAAAVLAKVEGGAS